MENFLYLFVLLALGKISRRLPAFPENTPQFLNLFVIYFSFPAVVLLQTHKLDLKSELAALAIIPWMLVLMSVLMVRMISGVLNWDRKLTGAVMLSVALGNTSFFGFPAVASFFGEDYLSYAIIYDQFGSFLALAIFGTIVVSVYGTGEKISAKEIIKKVIYFPPFFALMAGFLLMRIAYPSIMVKILEGLSATLTPLVIFSVGAQLKLRQPLSNVKPISIAIFLKMVVSPLVAFLILFMLNVRGPVLQISVFEAAMPSMVMSGILSQSGKLNAEVANAAIGYGLVFSFITFPLLHSLLKFFP